MGQPYAVLKDGSRWTPGTPFSVDYPGAICVPAHPSNFGYQDQQTGEPLKNEPLALGFHTPEEPADERETTPYYFQTPGISASTNYYHDNDGDVFQMVPDVCGAWGNGRQGIPWEDLPTYFRRHWPLNLQTLSTEVEGYTATIRSTLARVQWGSVLDWTRYKLRQNYIPAVRARLLGHYQVSNQRSDPGEWFMQKLWKEIEGGDMRFQRRNAVASWFSGRELAAGPDGTMRAAQDFGLRAGDKAVALEVILMPRQGEGSLMFFDGGTPVEAMVGYAGQVSNALAYGTVPYIELADDGTLRFRVTGVGVRVKTLGLLGVWR